MASVFGKAGRFNKATASLLAGALMTAIGLFLNIDPEVKDAAQVLIVTALVYWIPNKE